MPRKKSDREIMRVMVPRPLYESLQKAYQDLDAFVPGLYESFDEFVTVSLRDGLMKLRQYLRQEREIKEIESRVSRK